MTNQLILNSLHIYTHSSGDKYTATVAFSGYGSKVELKLGPELAQRILQMCMIDIEEAIHNSANHALEAMGAAIAKQIEPPEVYTTAKDDDEEVPF